MGDVVCRPLDTIEVDLDGKTLVMLSRRMRPAEMTSVERRDFLKSLAAGGLLLAVGSTGDAAEQQEADGSGIPATINGWVRVSPSGAVTVLTNTSEIGQGTGTALAQILAEELDLEWVSIRIEMAPIEPRYFNPKWGQYATYGSAGIAGQFEALRKAGAQARAMLVAAAADAWQISSTECETRDGKVLHSPSNRHLTYGNLAAAAARQTIPSDVTLKPQSRWKLIGQPMKRFDIPSKVDGSARYGIDVTMPGLLVAAIRQSPRFGGRLSRVDPAPALAVAGVRQVVPMTDAVAVIAQDFWTASQALAKLAPEWDTRDASSATSAEYNRQLVEAAKRGGALYVPAGATVDGVTGAFDRAMSSGVRHFEAIYTVPFLSHAPMEPMNATARVSGSTVELWLPTQNPTDAAAAVAAELGLPVSAVTVHVTLSGGGFGRRVEFDYALQAARIAKAAGAPVKLVWSREEDMRHDFYRPAAAVRLMAGVSADGLPVALRFDSACESLLYYSGGGNRRAALPVDRSALGTPPAFYSLGPMLFTVATMDVGVPVGYWRSVAASQNIFAYESFFDELAHSASIDPAEWRRRLIPEGSRARRVLEAVLEHSNWQRPGVTGRHCGMAIVHVNGSFVAHVVEISVLERDAILIHRVTTVIDCGIAVNPDSIRAQIEGSVAFALSATMYGEITVHNGAVTQSNFDTYRPIRLTEMPPVEVIIMNSTESPGGVGEEAVGPFAPALVNALFAATGRRIRDLPLSRAGYTLAPSLHAAANRA